MKNSSSHTFSDWVIGVGASAGGLEALSQFLSNIPKELNASIIVAQHLAPHSRSMMVELLARQSALPVVKVENNVKLEPATIYVVPPNHDVDVNDSRLILTVADDAIRPKPSIDELFESLARSCKDKCVGIILSGTGSDGSRGIRAIKEAGGITLAQDDQSAKYDGMPKSAVDTGKVDSILPPEALAKNLPRIILDHEARKLNRRIDSSALIPIYEIIKDKLGQDFSQYRPSTISRRVAKRMSFLHIRTHEDYADHLRNTPGEIGELANDLLISVTSFFRDSDVFRDLEKELERRFKIETPNEFRAWVAGCATGEEAYTLAILLLELQNRLRKNFPIKIFATDLDFEAIQEARNAVYTEKDMQAMPKALVEHYFHQRPDARFEVTKRVRDCVVFARQDLIQNPPFVKLDLITCRNVMIYFEPELQRKILEIFHYALGLGGLLVLGKSESILSTPQLFDVIDKKTKIFEKLNVVSHPQLMNRISRSTPLSIPSYRKTVAAPSFIDIGQRKLLKAFSIAGVVIDSEALLIQVVGDVSPYFNLENFQSDLRLPNLLEKNVGVEIPILIKKATKDGQSHRSRTHKSRRLTKPFSYNISVRPLYDEDDNENASKNFFLVAFEPKSLVAEPEVVHHDTSSSTSDIPLHVAELEQELFTTKEHLQTVIEELGVTNEELQSVNEELSSTNEELQASNEELETTNEELQSSNEELTTVNEELTAKSHELRMTSLELENIQDSIGSPLIVLDTQLRLQRFNTDARKIFYVSEADIGREITRISARCEISDFQQLTEKTLQTGEPNEHLCETDKSVYQLRILPSRDENQKIIGVIMIFIDNTDRIRAQEKLTASESRIRAIIDGSPSLICLKDNMGRYLLMNSAFKKFFNLQEDVIGKTDREILPDAVAIQFRDADLEVFIKRTPLKCEELVKNEAGVEFTLLSHRFPVLDASGKTPIAVGTIAIDISNQIEAQHSLQKSEMLYRAIAEDQAVLVCRHSPKGRLTYANETFTRYFGENIHSVLKKSFSDLVDLQDRKITDEILKGLTTSQPVAQEEHRSQRWHEGQRWLRWIHKGLFDPNENLVEIQSVGFDVTDYRVRTEELQQKEAVFAGIFNNTSDYITLFKISDGDIVLESLNRSAEKALSVSGQQLLGKKLEDIFPAPQGDQIIQRYNLALAKKQPQVFEEESIIAGRSRQFLTTIVPIPGFDGQIKWIAALSRDISSYKSIESDLRSAKDVADIANRAKSDFLASMSHELRTPLNVVLGYCQMLELSTLEEKQLKLVDGIHRSGQLLLNLIEDILDISKIEAGKVRLETLSFNIGTFISELEEVFSAQAKVKKLKLVFEVSSRAQKTVLGDPNRLKQIMVNFIGNALKFTSDGEVRIKVDAQPSGVSGELQYNFAVKDTGIGIKDDDKQKIFKKFSQAESGHARRFGGSGLGLAISQQLVQLMGGEVGFESQYRHGSTFWFKIPLVISLLPAEVSSNSSHERDQQHIRNAKPVRVLVTDDSDDSREIASLFLQQLGHPFAAVSSGSGAIREIQKKDYDLILMDMQMPEMDGCETTEAIRKLGSDIVIVALTANALREDVNKCLESGMNDYLSKPVRLNDLRQMLNKWSVKIRSTRAADIEPT